MSRMAGSLLIASDIFELVLTDSNKGAAILGKIHEGGFGTVIVTNVTLAVVFDRLSKMRDDDSITRARGLLFRRPDQPYQKQRTIPIAIQNITTDAWSAAVYWYIVHSKPLMPTGERDEIIDLDIAGWCDIGMIQQKFAHRIISNNPAYSRVKELTKKDVTGKKYPKFNILK